MEDTTRVTLDDLLIVRDEEGNIEPLEVYSSVFKKDILLKPMTYGWIKKYGADMDIPASKWELPKQLQCLKDHIVDPDLSSLTIKDIEESTDPLTVKHLLSLVVIHSVPTFRLRQDKRPDIQALAEALKSILSESASQTSKPSSIKSDINIPA